MRNTEEAHHLIPSQRLVLLPQEPVMVRGRSYQTRGGLRTGWGCAIVGRMNRFGQWHVVHTAAFTQRIDGELVDVDVLETHWPNGACIGDPSYDTQEYAAWADAYIRIKALLKIKEPNPYQVAEICLLTGKPVEQVVKALGIKKSKAKAA